MNFSSVAHGKWILAGEHTVLRGGPAIVFPLHSRSMSLEYRPGTAPLTTTFKNESSKKLSSLMEESIAKALERVAAPASHLKGELSLSSNIPLGRGLGASAALSVNVSRLFAWLKDIPQSDISEFATNLENISHGESSGVDVRASMSETGICFYRDQPSVEFKPTWPPHWYLSFSGATGITSTCVEKVQKFIADDPAAGKKIDDQMQASVLAAKAALQAPKSLASFRQLGDAINLARDCFEQWGLTTPAMDEQTQQMLQAGAIAVKPTGSGGGGYLLSLWEQKPTTSFPFELIPCSKEGNSNE